MIRRFMLAWLAGAALLACGGGGDSEPEIVLSQPGQVHVFANSERKPGPVTLTFGLLFQDYFKCVANGHAGVMLRADLGRIPTGYYRGVGLAFGRFGSDSYTTRNLPHLEPVAVLETWAVGDAPPEFDSILAQTARTGLRDGVVYRVSITSAPTPAGNLIRYSMDGFDSGDVIDANPVVDMSQKAVVFYDAGGVSHCPYSIRILNPQLS